MHLDEYLMPQQSCPNCGHAINRASGPDGVPPSVGDITVCVACEAPLQVGPGRLLIKLDPDLPGVDWEQVRMMQRALRLSKKRR